MPHEASQALPSASTSGLCAEKVGRLLTTVTQVADMRLDVSDCRTEILTVLLESIDADAGMRTWSVSDDAATEIAFLAQIDINFDDIDGVAGKPFEIVNTGTGLPVEMTSETPMISFDDEKTVVDFTLRSFDPSGMSTDRLDDGVY